MVMDRFFGIFPKEGAVYEIENPRRTEFTCSQCSFLIFVVESHDGIQTLHYPYGTMARVVDPKQNKAEVICEKCSAANPFEMAILKLPRVRWLSQRDENRRWQDLHRDERGWLARRGPDNPIEHHAVMHLCGFVGWDFSINWMVKIQAISSAMYRTGSINIHLHMPGPDSRRADERAAMTFACQALRAIDWLIPLGDYWLVKPYKLGNAIPSLAPALGRCLWAREDVLIKPKYEFEDRPDSPIPHNFALSYASDEIAPEMNPPRQIEDSLLAFRKDHPDPMRTGFIVMKFGTTRGHKGIVDAIRATLAETGLEGVRADEKEYHPDQFGNVLTYVWGCSFGIAVFERLSDDDINPNVSLEVGYMLALEKKVAFLKDKTLRTLPTDLAGKLYKPFDPQRIKPTIKAHLTQWLKDHGLLPSPPTPS